MSKFSRHNIEPENRIELAYKGKREHFITPNTPNKAYPGQVVKAVIPRGSSDIIMVRETQRVSFNLELKLIDKGRSLVRDVGRRSVVKKTLSLGSTDIEIIETADIFDIYEDLYLSKIDRDNLLLQSIQSDNGLKARVGGKRSDGTDLTLSTEENAFVRTLGNRFEIPPDIDFLMQPYCPYYLKKWFKYYH